MLHDWGTKWCFNWKICWHHRLLGAKPHCTANHWNVKVATLTTLSSSCSRIYIVMTPSNEPTKIMMGIFKNISYIPGCSWTTQRAKSRGFRGESPGILVVGGGNPRGNLGCKWNENPRRNSGEIFKLGLKWEESFPKPVNIKIHQIMTSNHHWDTFT